VVDSGTFMYDKHGNLSTWTPLTPKQQKTPWGTVYYSVNVGFRVGNFEGKVWWTCKTSRTSLSFSSLI